MLENKNYKIKYDYIFLFGLVYFFDIYLKVIVCELFRRVIVSKGIGGLF